MLLKILKWLGISSLAIALVIGITATLFVNLSPQFGGSATDEQLAIYEATGHFTDGIWTNPEEIKMELDCHSVEQMVKEIHKIVVKEKG